MTDQRNDAVRPCPFCGEELYGPHISDIEVQYWMHPGVMTDGKCFFSGKGIYDYQVPVWNERAHRFNSQAVINLVIAAREAWEADCVSGDALDKALEPFAALVPYENEPDESTLSPLSGEPASPMSELQALGQEFDAPASVAGEAAPDAATGCADNFLPVPASIPSAVSMIARIAQVSEAIGFQAGVGAMETAGSIVSYLHRHPYQIAPFLAGETSPVDWPSCWHRLGCLSWHAMNGKIVHPDTLAQGIAAGTDETPQAAQPEGQEPGPKDAPKGGDA